MKVMNGVGRSTYTKCPFFCLRVSERVLVNRKLSTLYLNLDSTDWNFGCGKRDMEFYETECLI